MMLYYATLSYYIMLYWALLLKGQMGRGAVWAQSDHLAQYYDHILLARSDIVEDERANTSAVSEAWL